MTKAQRRRPAGKQQRAGSERPGLGKGDIAPPRSESSPTSPDAAPPMPRERTRANPIHRIGRIVVGDPGAFHDARQR
jgi:hypothetical protein